MPRWSQKPGIEAIEHDAQNMVRVGDRVALEVDVTVTAETLERMRLGYMCAKCYEPQETPFPEVCSLPGCGFPIREKNLEKIAQDFAGERWLGPQQSIEDELAGLAERSERRRKSGIVLPPGVSGT